MVTVLLIAIAGGLLGWATGWAIGRIRDRWRRRRPASDERCAMCAVEHPLTGGPPVRDPHEVIARPDDDLERDLRVIGGGGGSYVAAVFCKRHCPGNCQNRRCRKRATLKA